MKRVNSHKEPTRKDYELLDLTLSWSLLLRHVLRESDFLTTLLCKYFCGSICQSAEKGVNDSLESIMILKIVSAD